MTESQQCTRAFKALVTNKYRTCLRGMSEGKHSSPCGLVLQQCCKWVDICCRLYAPHLHNPCEGLPACTVLCLGHQVDQISTVVFMGCSLQV